MAILISGSLEYNHIINFPDSFRHYIKLGQPHILDVRFAVEELRKTRGGTAGNIAYTMKLLGATPLVISALGNDSADYQQHLKAVGINQEHIPVDNERPTAASYVTTDADDNEITAVFRGPLAHTKSLHDLKEKIDIAVVAGNHEDAMIKHMKECAELGVKTFFYPAEHIDTFNEAELKRMVSQAFCVIGNDYEMKLLQEKTGWSAKEILNQVKVLVTTLGEEGSYIITAEGDEMKVAACKPRSFDDPTGAGDAYCAGFVAGYELGYDWKTCGQMGSVAASYAIEVFGTQEHTFSTEEFCQRYKQEYGKDITLDR